MDFLFAHVFLWKDGFVFLCFFVCFFGGFWDGRVAYCILGWLFFLFFSRKCFFWMALCYEQV